MKNYLNSLLLSTSVFLFTNLMAQSNTGSMYGIGESSDQYAVNPAANPSVLDYNDSGFTLETWIFPIELPKSVSFYSGIVQRLTRIYLSPTFYTTGPRYNLKTKYQNNHYVEFVISNGDDGTIDVSLLSSTPLVFGAWTHVAVTYDGSIIQLYIDGNPDTQVIFMNSIAPAAEDAGFFIGHYRPNEMLIDDVRLWNIARSATQIKDNRFNQLIPENEINLVGYWPLNESKSEFNHIITEDVTSNQNDLMSYARFVKTTHKSESEAETSPYIEENFGTIEFPPVETQFSSYQMINITNTGDSCLYGRLNAVGPKLSGSNFFFVDGNSSYGFNIHISPSEGGDIEENIIFEEGNAFNLGLEIPVKISAIALNKFDVNNISMWIQRNGSFAHNLLYQDPGFEWPKGENKNVIYASGVWIGAEINGELHTAIASYSNSAFEFVPGQILENGEPDNPDQVKYRVYKIDKNSGPGDKDYDEWPGYENAPAGDMGALWDIENNRPDMRGADQMLFVVYNDADETAHSHMGSRPLGAEIRQHVYGWDTPGALENTIFMEFTLKNKSDQTWNDTYFAIWSDPDVGYYGDDLVGFDIERQMAYAYNGFPNDNIYGETPPAIGYDLLKGVFIGYPTADAFSYYTAGGSGLQDPSNPYEVYNHLNGSLYPDDYPLSGDPVNPDGGDIDSDPGDRRFLISTGPFDLSPNAERSIAIAIIVAQGLNNINSVYELDQASDAIQAYYNEGLFNGGAIENISTIQLEPNIPGTLDDIENSGMVLTSTADDDGATVELVTFSGAPVGTEETEKSMVHGVGSYLEINVQGTVIWPVELTMYYTANDLAEAGIDENEIAGLYYYSSSERKWKLYSESATDDNGLGPSTTEVHSENITLNDIEYEGYVSAMAYHLTAIRMGFYP